ncbi:hypothetical protein E2320_002216 [Naja naja]|nr:hypothetical protein E2320_002216 [Naja naja]
MQDKVPRCSVAQSVQMGEIPQASTSKVPVDDYPSEIEQPLPATHDSEEMGVQEPACKKPKMGDEEQPPTDTWNDSVSDERDMSETKTAGECEPSEDFDCLNTTEEPSVYLESVQVWQRNLQHYRATEYYERYRFVNMEHVHSFTCAIDIIHNEIQRLLNCISRVISPNDFVQLRLDAEELGRPLFSVRRPVDELKADQFLSYVESLLQSNVELLWRNSLELTVTIVKNHEGGSLRKLGTVLISKILEKKRQHLIDFNVAGLFLCFAGSLLSLLDNGVSTKEEIITRAMALHNTLGLSTAHRIDFSQIHLFEDHFGITLKVMFYHKGGWRFFVTGGTLDVRVVFMLLHDKHYYGVKNIKGFMGARYFCELCHTGYRYIVYDFECCQETGTHIPNYVYAMDMLEDGDVRRWEWYSEKCLEEFVKTFVQPKFRGSTFIAHNSKSYDGYLILRQLICEKVKVQLLTQGGKLLCITLPLLHIRFIDSLSFLPMKLSKLPKAMGFQDSKGYFPHLFNMSENQDYVGTLPDAKYYSPETMMPASICMAQYRFMFLKKDTIALAPLDNYQKSKKSFSACSIQWLMYIEHTEGIHIQHALQGGEKKVGIYFLDDFAVINGVLTAFEFYGCFFQGCPICYKPQDFNSLLDSTYGMLYALTRTREDYLKSEGYVVRCIWEHEWNDMLKNNEGLKCFLADCKLPTPLNPRAAFFGGRTNTTCLYYKLKRGEQILYYDFTSLYPFVNKNEAYPIGHPEIIYQNFGNIKQYFGFAKVHTEGPLLSGTATQVGGGELMFSLCATCTEKQQVTECHHNDEETGTGCTVELNVAVEKG